MRWSRPRPCVTTCACCWLTGRSGHAEPSRADELLTQSLKSVLALVDVRVLDHFIVTRSTVVSFAEQGLL